MALGLSWFVVRKRKEGLFLWAAFVILFINLVNFSGVSELLIALQFSCPLILACLLIRDSRLFKFLAILLFLFIFFLHPLVAIIFITIALVAAYVGYKKIETRKTMWRVAVFFLVAAGLKLLLNIYLLTMYENSFLESKGMSNYVLETSPENKVFLAVAVLIGAGCLFSNSKLKFALRNSPGSIYLIFRLSAVLAGVILVSQYSYQLFPLKTGLATIAALCIFIMTAIDSIQELPASEFAQRFRLISLLAVVFSLVVAAKSVIWQASIQKLKESLAQSKSSCVELEAENLKWLDKNPYRIINTWALPTLALIEQNNAPRKLLLEKSSCKIFHDSGVVKFDEWTIIPKHLIIPTLDH